MRKLTPMLALVAMVAISCATFQQNAGKTLATVASTVDAAMKGWATYVVVSGQVPSEQQAKVKDAYVKYQASMALAQAAYNGLANSAGKDAWNQALTLLQANQAALLNLVASFSQSGGAK